MYRVHFRDRGHQSENSVAPRYLMRGKMRASFIRSRGTHVYFMPLHVSNIGEERENMTVATGLSPFPSLSLSLLRDVPPRQNRVPDWIFKRSVPENGWLDHRF